MSYKKVPEQEVDSSVLKNSRIAVAAGVEAVLKESEVRLAGVSGSSNKTKLRVLRQVSEQLQAVIENSVSCKRGCFACCTMAVAVSYAEAEQIGHSIGVQPSCKGIGGSDAGCEEDLEELADAIDKYLNVPCPFLEEGICGIYEYRPIACRLHHNLSDFPILCDTLNNPGSDVPALNFSQVHFAYTSLFFAEGFHDIRRFFPLGLRSKV